MVSVIKKYSLPLLVTFASLGIAVGLAVACWDINFWPTDAKAYYFDAAVQLPRFSHISEMHSMVDQAEVRWLHGKEIYVLGVSLMQRLIADTQTLRPFLLLGIAAILGSSIFLFFIASSYFGPVIGGICFFLFATSFWPYIYILFAKHQTLGLFFFLFALWLVPLSFNKKAGWIYGLASGLLLGLSFFSSTVSALYLPFYAAAVFFHGVYVHRKTVKIQRGHLSRLGPIVALIAVGFIAAVIYVNGPDVFQNVKSFFEYVNISGAYNHFYYNQPHLKQWFPDTAVATVRGGWLWVLKYCFTVMPVLFPAYLASIGFLAVSVLRVKGRVMMETVLLILLSIAPVLMAEAAQVAQYGANYFPFFFGVIFLLGFALSRLSAKSLLLKRKKKVFILGVCLMLLHAGWNAFDFWTDIYPCRMVTTFLSRAMKKLEVRDVYTYVLNPHRDYFLRYLNPGLLRQTSFRPMSSLAEAREGYILLPPVTGDSIYIASMSYYTDFEDDIILNTLVEKNLLKDFAVCSFKTLINSRFWVLEEEIFAYRKLMLGHRIPEQEAKGHVWLLDAGKLARELPLIVPHPSLVFMHANNIRTIGAKNKLYAYRGYSGEAASTREVRNVVAKIYKQGEPTGSLRMYVYRIGDNHHVWVPFGDNWVSEPVLPEKISSDPASAFAAFRFDPPLMLEKGKYFFQILKKGDRGDQDYYLIHKDFIGMYPRDILF